MCMLNDDTDTSSQRMMNIECTRKIKQNRKDDCCTSERKGGQSTHTIKDVYWKKKRTKETIE